MMAVKFKVGFTMSAETLFGIIAKFLPVEDLQVEEVPPHFPEKLPKIGKIAQPAIAPPKRPPLKRNRHSGTSLEGGCNAIILKTLEDGQPHRYRELKLAVTAAGYAGSGIGSKLSRLRDLHAVHQPSLGRWQIGEAPPAKKTA
jgi:hypothetical protein